MNNIFNGPFKEYLQAYYQYKVNLGYKFDSEKVKLIAFDNYTLKNNINIFSLDVIKNFIDSKDITQNSKASIASVLRAFINYLYQQNLCDFVLPTRLYRRKSRKVPYIFTDEEIKIFFETLNSFYPEDKFKNNILQLCFKSLYCTGMRISECLNIKFSDINFDNNSISLYNTKNNVDRIIVITDSLINDYKKLKENYKDIYDTNDSYIFIKHNGDKYIRGDMYVYFRKILYYAGIEHNESGPRLHDFRHTFCVKSYQNILKKNSNDLHNRIVALSAYVGHKDFKSTEYYLRLTSELYPEIRNIIEKYTSDIIGEIGDLDE